MEYGISGKIAVVTGAGGAICGEIAKGLAVEGAYVAIWDISTAAGEARRDEIVSAGGRSISLECDVKDEKSVARALADTVSEFGTIDILVNGAGGSRKETTTSPDLSFFDIEQDAMREVMALNYLGTVIPSQAVGRIFADKKSGVILNITSVAGLTPLTRALSYCNGKAAANSFTRWLAVHMAREYAPGIRVNAIAPGFILTDQNRFLLLDANGETTSRGRQIVDAVPMSRYGEPREIVGAALWLVSDMAGFVTGTVIPVDGGFTASSGV